MMTTIDRNQRESGLASASGSHNPVQSSDYHDKSQISEALPGKMTHVQTDADSKIARCNRSANILQESSATYAVVQKKSHTIDEIYALPEGVRAELIDGQIYYMAAPVRKHQVIAGEMYFAVASYIKAHNGRCHVYISSFAVFLFGDDSTYVEPDLSVICDPDKLDHRGCTGAPDWIVEILSPSTAQIDRIIKLAKYREAGVLEYWIIDPVSETTAVFLFHPEDETQESAQVYRFEDTLSCSVLPGLQVCVKEMLAHY